MSDSSTMISFCAHSFFVGKFHSFTLFVVGHSRSFMSAQPSYMTEGTVLAKIFTPLVSFATSPQNAPSLLISTLLVNALAFEIRLNLTYLILTYVLIAIYFALLWTYPIITANPSQTDLKKFTRHVFYASIFGGLALVILWSDFVRLQPALSSQIPLFPALSSTRASARAFIWFCKERISMPS